MIHKERRYASTAIAQRRVGNGPPPVGSGPQGGDEGSVFSGGAAPGQLLPRRPPLAGQGQGLSTTRTRVAGPRSSSHPLPRGV